MYINGNKNLVSPQAIYAQPNNRKGNYLDRKFKESESKDILFLCIQSLELASKSDQEKVFKNLNRILEVHI